MPDFRKLINKAARNYNSGCCGCDRSSLLDGIELTLSMTLPDDVVEGVIKAIRDRAEELYLAANPD